MKLNPYLHFSGNAEEALNFYRDVFNGEIIRLSRYADGPMPVDDDWKSKLMHVSLKFGDCLIMISDGPKGYKSSTDGNIQLSVDFEDADKMENTFNKLAGGGTIVLPLAKQFWGARFGMLKDKYGIGWMFNHEEK